MRAGKMRQKMLMKILPKSKQPISRPRTIRSWSAYMGNCVLQCEVIRVAYVSSPPRLQDAPSGSVTDAYLSLVYLLHAYDYQPDDPVICLSLAVAYLGRAMQRQSDNRHYMIAQVRTAYYFSDRITYVIAATESGIPNPVSPYPRKGPRQHG